VLESGQTLSQAAIAFSSGNGGQAQPPYDPNPACTAASGSCIDSSQNSCSGGSFHSGLCPSGGATVLCCVGGTAGPIDPNPQCTAAGGSCIDTSQNQCSGSLLHGDCQGNDNILCCVSAPSGPPMGAGKAKPKPNKHRLLTANPKAKANKAKPQQATVKGAAKKLRFLNHSGHPTGESCGETIRRALTKKGAYTPHGPIKVSRPSPIQSHPENAVLTLHNPRHKHENLHEEDTDQEPPRRHRRHRQFD